MDNYFTGTQEFGGCKLTYNLGFLIKKEDKDGYVEYIYATLPDGTPVIKEETTNCKGKIKRTVFFYSVTELLQKVTLDGEDITIETFSRKGGFYACEVTKNGKKCWSGMLVDNPAFVVSRYKVKQPCETSKVSNITINLNISPTMSMTEIGELVLEQLSLKIKEISGNDYKI
jgi:hypothetical protein